MKTMDKKPNSRATLVQDIKPKRDPFYTDPESINVFCDYVSGGGHMAGFCRERGLKYAAVDWWVEQNPERSAMYARARARRADVLADEIVAIADEKDVVASYNGEEVTLALDSTAVARNRLRVDARKWAASKLRPGTYGDKTTTEHTGKDGAPIQIAAMDFKGLSDAELQQMQQMMLKAAAEKLPPPPVGG